MFGPAQRKVYRPPQQRFWDPLLARVYGIRPWEMGRLTIREHRLIVEDLERFGLGSGFGG